MYRNDCEDQEQIKSIKKKTRAHTHRHTKRKMKNTHQGISEQVNRIQEIIFHRRFLFGRLAYLSSYRST